ncbi:ABC transporter ATP-binding protein [Massilia sp. CCM 9210]|uniref:ABC transporter transmembrane domain-containing protein n=1 Tax=Massilia scottii TaxID=3057166 RepID=UPI0027968738|nr:ABC transporter ATP-binding protein [Massilia sp. CCM 9210]MDQ1816191.1 ABC transporter ATP-binding protein [Massilia sp. CCM 9210]
MNTQSKDNPGSSRKLDDSSTFRNFFSMLGAARRQYWTALFCNCVAAGSETIIHPLLVKEIFDGVNQGTELSRFVMLVFFYLLLGVVLNVIGYYLSLWQMRIDNKIVADISGRVLHAYYGKEYGDVLRDGSGYYLARIRSDVKDGLVPMLILVRRATICAVMFVGLISVLIILSWQAFLILAALIPVATWVSVKVSKKIRHLALVERDNEASLMGVLTKSVDAFKMVRTYMMVPQTLDKFNRTMDETLESGYQKQRVIRRLQTASDLTMSVSDACSIFIGSLLVLKKQMTIGAYFSFMNAFWRSATTLIQIFSLSAELHALGAIVNRLKSFIDDQNAVPYHKSGSAVAASGISYSYADNEVISDFSIHVEPGTRLLIVGNNGSGKTTLANMLAGYLSPSSGQLELPREISAATLPVLFPPLRVRDLEIKTELFKRFMIDKPDILDAYPDQLSAGQQQKVSLALALSKEADLYVLDEPLANLDINSRQIAMAAVWEHTKGKILVMIMHASEEYYAMFDKVHTLGTSASVPSRQVVEAVETEEAQPG